jgi:hypothetical protein
MSLCVCRAILPFLKGNKMVKLLKKSIPANAEVQGKPVVPGTVTEATDKVQNLLGDGEAAGFALAQSVIGVAREHGNTWNYYVAKLIAASDNTRVAFIKNISKHVREIAGHVKATSETGKIADADPVFRGAGTSARTRLSEFVQITKALQAGMDVPVKRNEQGIPVLNTRGDMQVDIPYTAVVGLARATLGSQAQGRGRPAKPFIDKLKAYVKQNAETLDDIKAGVELLATMLKLGNMEAIKAEEPKPEVVKK